MKANELIRRSLRLINQPGRGARISAADMSDAFEALQEILDSEAVSKAFVPGIRRHFFNMVQGKAIYSYGASPQADLRSDDFDDDPAPIRIEDAYIREGSTITNNEIIDNYRFENMGLWIPGPGARIRDNLLVHEQVSASTTQDLSAQGLIDGATYTLRVDLTLFNGTVEIRLRDSGVAFETFVLDNSGTFSFDFVWNGVTAPDIEVFTGLPTDDVRIDVLSVIERGKDRLELPDSRGSDYSIVIVNQKRYNRRFTKGTGGRPYNILYSRAYPLSEIRFDNSSVTGDILVMDVLVNRVQVSTLESEVRMHPEATKWLRYALADNIAAEYGKELSFVQRDIMKTSWSRLTTGNRRFNSLRADKALLDRPTFDINRGDP